MDIKVLTPEVESVREDYSWMEVMFIHPFIEDMYARVALTDKTEEFRAVCSSDDFSEEDKAELIKAAREFYAEKVSEYEEEKREREEYYRDWKADYEEQQLYQ